MTHRAGAVVEMFTGIAAEVLEDPLVHPEEPAQPLVGGRAEKTSARESERQHVQILHDLALPEPHSRPPPVDLEPLTLRRLEARLGQL